MKTVLLVSRYNWDTSAEVPYIFNKAGFKIAIYCPASSWLSYNSYYHSHYVAPEDEESFLSQLEFLLKEHKFDWVILTEDPLIDLIKRKIHQVGLFLEILPIKNSLAFDILSSKIGFSKYFQSIGIPTPSFKSYINGRDAIESLSSLNFPVLNKYELSWGGTDISISQDMGQLELKLKTISPNATLLIQEYIDGEEIRVDALFINGILLNLFCSKVLSNTKDRFSYTTRRSYYEDPKLIELVSLIGEKVVAHGFANITLIREYKSGIDYLIEMDMRPNSWMAYSEYLSGYHFVYCLHNLNNPARLNFQKAKLKKNRPIELALFYKDIRRAIWSKDVKGVIRWFLGFNGYWKFLPLYDRKLFKKIIKEIWEEIGKYKLNKIKQKFRR